MTNDEIQMTNDKQIRNTNIRHLDFDIRHSFVI